MLFGAAIPTGRLPGKHYNKILATLGTRFDELAFLYVVPFRTRGDKGSTMSRRFVDNGYEKHLKKQMALLSPGTVIAMDQRSEESANRYRREEVPETTVCYWTRQRNVPDSQRFAALRACNRFGRRHVSSRSSVNPTAGDYKGWPIDEDEWRAIFD